MNNKKGFTPHRSGAGFTLIELLIAMTIILIVSLGFFAWATTIIQADLAMQKNNTAYTIAMDVADRLQRMSDNSLIQPKTANEKYVGFNASGDLKKCVSGSPTGTISADSTGLTEYTNPWNNTSKLLYLYDNNNCEGKTWVDSTCGSSVSIASSANGSVDHPNAAGAAYDSINPVRYYNNTTYYAVWSVTYMPCTATTTNLRKIFVTVYWIDPEPKDTTVSAVQTKLDNGTYKTKSVSVVVDKAIGTES